MSPLPWVIMIGPQDLHFSCKVVRDVDRAIVPCESYAIRTLPTSKWLFFNSAIRRALLGPLLTESVL
jgi:hypothetical protein